MWRVVYLHVHVRAWTLHVPLSNPIFYDDILHMVSLLLCTVFLPIYSTHYMIIIFPCALYSSCQLHLLLFSRFHSPRHPCWSHSRQGLHDKFSFAFFLTDTCYTMGIFWDFIFIFLFTCARVHASLSWLKKMSCRSSPLQCVDDALCAHGCAHDDALCAHGLAVSKL